MNQRTELLLTKEELDLYQSKVIAVFGIGGVGGYVLEALVRSGFENIYIYDFDQVDESNLNRQIISSIDMIGQQKVEVALKRMKSINPKVNLIINNLWIDKETINTIDFKKFDYVVDAIDFVEGKIEIIKKCFENNVKLISSMGTGNKLDPTKLCITDLQKTTICPLARVVRKKCKELGIKHFKVLASTEVPRKPSENKVGSMIFVPASAGLLIASYILRDLIGDLNNA